MSQIQLFDYTFALSNDLAFALILLLPVMGTIGLMIWQQPKYFEAVGVMLGILLNIPYLLLLNILAEYVGWWEYASSQNSFYNIPVELIIGWAVFWGAFLPYLCREIPIVFPIIFAVVLDVVLMPQLGGIFVLGEYWLIGEAVFILTCLLPSLIIFKLTTQRRFIIGRSFIQSMIWGGWIVFLIPAIIFNFEGTDIFSIFQWNTIHTGLFLVGMVVSGLIGYAGLWEFAIKGQGTPIPFDPPQKLVTTGIYAYVANPLQISTSLMFLCLMVAYQSPLMICAIIAHVFYSEVFVRWHQEIDIAERFGDNWLDYKSKTRNWLPRSSSSEVKMQENTNIEI